MLINRSSESLFVTRSVFRPPSRRSAPALRAAIGPDWRGTIITVDGIRVKLIDWCQCYRGEPSEKLLDLYYDVFARTGSTVTVRW